MGKRITIIISVLLFFGLAIMGYFLQQGRKTLYTDPYNAVSPEACIVIETIDLQSFLNSLTAKKGLFGEAAKIREFGSFNQKLRYIADQMNKPEVKKFLPDGLAILSFYPTKDGKLKILVSMSVRRGIKYRHIKNLLNTTSVNNVIESKRNGKQFLLVPYSIQNGQDTAYISLVSGLILFSSSPEVISRATDQITSGDDVRSLPGFSRVLLASGKNEDKIFVVFSNFADLLNSITSGKGKGLNDKIPKIAGTAGGDIYLRDDGFVLSGYTESIDSTDYLYKYKLIQPREFRTYKILPKSTVLFETLISPSDSKANLNDTSFSKQALNLASAIKEYTGEEITRAYIDIKGNPESDLTLIIYKLSNRVQAEQIFLEKLGTDNQTLYFQPDDQTKIPVYRTSFNGLINILVPGFAPGFDDIYFAFYDNYLITGNSFVTISRLLYDNILNKTLANDLNYRDFVSTLPSRAGYFFYCVPAKISEYLAGFLNEPIVRSLKLNRNSLSKIQAAGYQLAASNGMVYNSISVRFKEGAREESNTDWETLLDTTACIKPFFFTNHITGAKEIFIQDMKNNTYLINSAGRVLWKVPLNERIIGNIYMIDYFNNGKYQLLFAGTNYIHLLDRNGNYVERYPVKLRSPATNPIALFDYDNNQNYRLFVAGEDKLIYSYDKTGNVVKGWKPYRTPGFVNTEISYFKISGKDYLVASDEISVYLLDRSGNKRLNLNEPVTKAAKSAMRLIPGNEPYLVCTAPDGTVQQIYFDGTVKKFSLKKFSVDHSFDIFDVDGDGNYEYMFIDKGTLYLYGHNKSQIFAREFGSTELGGPINFIFSANDRKIGVFDINKKLIYLIGKNGETMKGFPLTGASMFSIGKLSDNSDWHLIVGGTDKFLYNYKIDTENK
jgi:hypothetical protein